MYSIAECSKLNYALQRAHVSMEIVGHIHEAFMISPKKSTVQARMELHIPKPTNWKVLSKGLQFKPHSLQLV
jgi:hypothetical protein